MKNFKKLTVEFTPAQLIHYYITYSNIMFQYIFKTLSFSCLSNWGRCMDFTDFATFLQRGGGEGY